MARTAGKKSFFCQSSSVFVVFSDKLSVFTSFQETAEISMLQLQTY